MSFKLAISAGHWLGNVNGCPAELDPSQTREWVLNARIADKLQTILATYDGIEVLRVDDATGKAKITNAMRAQRANEWGADLYLSIHHNAATVIFSGGGITAHIHDKNAKPGAEEWQKAFYDAAIKHTRLKGDRASPLVKQSLYECGAPNCPAVLMECGFMNSRVDCPIILTEEFADNTAKAFSEVIVERAGLSLKPAEPSETAEIKVAVSLPVLRYGSRGGAVRALQMLLRGRGYTDASKKALQFDGSFGPATLYALKAFQTAEGLAVDGSCGPATWKRLFE